MATISKSDIESLEDEAWISLALKNKILITGNEEQMQATAGEQRQDSGQRRVTVVRCWS